MSSTCWQSSNFPHCNGVPVDKCDPQPWEVSEFDPWTIYVPYESEVDVSAGECKPDVLNGFDATKWTAAARELWMGTVRGFVPAVPPLDPARNWSLRDAGVNVSAGAPVNVAVHPTTAYDVLIENYERATDTADPVVHVPFPLLGTLLDHRRVTQVGNVYRGVGNALVIPGPGYPFGLSAAGPGGFGPSSGGAGTGGPYFGSAAGEGWMFVSGPIIAEIGRERWSDDDDNADSSHGGMAERMNLTRYYREAHAIVAFDPCAVFGVLAFLPSAPTTEA